MVAPPRGICPLLLGPIQVNDAAELAAAFLTVEAVSDQPPTVQRSVEILIDKKAVRETCQVIA